MASVDCKKAFDSFSIKAIKKALEEQGIRKDYLQVLFEICYITIAHIKLHRSSYKIEFVRILRLGDNILLKLFSALLEECSRD